MTTYGPTKSGDTLWRIANKHRIAGVNTNTLINAIERLNPQAFRGANHSILKIGTTLKIPNSAAALKAALATTQDQAAPVVSNGTPPFHEVTKMSKMATLENTIAELKQIAQAAEQAHASSEQKVVQLQQQLASKPIATTQTSESNHFPWSWLWFILFIVSLVLYLLSKRSTHDRSPSTRRAAERLGHSNLNAREMTRYETIGESLRHLIPGNAMATRDKNIEGEGKVLADVMVKMAEGNLESAEKQLLNALREHKSNISLRLKLLEVYVAMNRQDAFNKQSEYMLKKALMSEGDAVWGKVRAMYLSHWVYD